MQNSGTLAELPLAGILESVQQDRATGTLMIKSDGRQATLYFLFGHLFHAIAGDVVGEAVVHDTLDWASGDFNFDSKAKLPAEETIKVSTAELLAAHAPNGAAAAGEPEPEPEPAEAEAVVEPEAAPEPEPEPAVEPEPEPEPVAKAAPAREPAEHPKRRRTDAEPDVRPPETMALYPMPLGKLIYEALTAGFVDFPKLLRSLAKDGHTGYVRLSSDGFTGLLLFASGAVVEAIYDAGAVSTGKVAFDQFGAHIDDGDGVLDVIELTPEMVTALFQLLTGRGMYEKLLARFVRVDALIEHLHESGASGALIVRQGTNNGIVLFREGHVLGAYTDESREASTDVAKVVELCNDPSTEIEVRGGPVPATLPVLDPGKGSPAEVPSGSTPAAAAPTVVRGAAPAVAPERRAPEPVAEPEPEAWAEPAAEAAPETEHADWGEVLNHMAARADEVLGTRSKKVKEMLYATPQGRGDVEQTLDRIAELSIMFVDPAKLTALADEMRGMMPTEA
ncbi:MAG TPA: DUF4388 domain-containing protein [Candidatus Dormibacteraeota bacterium]|nr:DUF4388 domain-containing protein [Candidatus Dormibacteraeota bacterium]